MAWHAKHRFARIAPRKAKLIADMIRGENAQHALNILKFTPNRAAGMIAKVLTSAVANANEAEADVDRLVVADARVDAGPDDEAVPGEGPRPGPSRSSSAPATSSWWSRRQA